MDAFNKFTSSVSTNWSPFAEKVGKSFTQYKQLASEKLGNVTDVTELPRDYIELEKRYEAVRQSTMTLLRLARSYSASSPNFDMQKLQHQFTTLTSKINTRNDAEAISSESAKQEEESPNTYLHAMARTSLEVSENIGLEEPLGAALFKFGSIEEKIGDSKLEHDESIRKKFIEPTVTTLDSSIALAQNGRKEVLAARLTLDAAKTTFKNAKPEKADSARRDVESAEDHFVTIVEETMNLMKSVVESPEHLRHLSDFVSSQLEFHKKAAELLSDLAPEISEIQETQEALYRHENK